MKPIFLLFLLVSLVYSYDIVVESLKRIDPSTPACDNFYRHACPLNSTNLMKDFEKVLEDRIRHIESEPWNQFDILNDFSNMQDYLDLPFKDLGKLFVSKCEAHEDTKNLLQYFEKFLSFENGHMDEKCNGNTYCASQLVYQKNCTLAGQLLGTDLHHMRFLENKNVPDIDESKLIETTAGAYAQNMVNDIKSWRDFVINGYLSKSSDIAKGRDWAEKMLKDLKTLLVDRIKSTKWVINNDGVEWITGLVNELSIHNFDKQIQQYSDHLKSMEQKYRRCKSDIESEEIFGKILCLLTSFQKIRIPNDVQGPLGSMINAFNNHPYINFGDVFYLATAEIDSVAGKVGLFGSIIAHEIGHSIFEDFQPTTIPQISIFPKKVINCIQDTFQRTCTKFVEKSCLITDEMIEDNGADMIRRELSYQLFRSYYGADYNKIYEPLNITNEQLFFYSSNIDFCRGEQSFYKLVGTMGDDHAANNIRALILAQHAEFKNAFHCPLDSPMVEVIEEECHIYGEKAPEI